MAVVFIVLCPLLNAAGYADDEGIESLRETGKAFASVARKVSPSVVFVEVESITTVRPAQSPFGRDWPFGDDFFRRFFGDEAPGVPRDSQPPAERRALGQGSGFVFARDDKLFGDKTYLVTNNHVVQNADSIRVTFDDGRQMDAQVVGHDPRSDIAVLEIAGADYPVLPLGSSADLEVGEWVVAIGSPFGLSHTLTVGVVSAKDRTSLGINDYEDFIQTDAAINPGNSGGPLVNLDGEVVGINTAIFSRSGGYMGIGFAIPIDLAKAIAQQLIDNGAVTRGYLGIVIQQLTPELAASFGLDTADGLLVAQVEDGSPAATAGLMQGDILVELQGQPIRDPGQFRNTIALIPPGSRQQLTLLRDGRRRTVNVTIGELDEQPGPASEPIRRAEVIGLTVQTLTPELARQFNIRDTTGVVVTAVEVGSVAARAGIRPGMVILQVDRKPVASAEAFERAVAESTADKRLLLLLKRGDVQQYVVLSW